MRPVTLHPYVARRAPPQSVPTVEVDVHVVPGHMHTPCVHGVEGAAAVEAREGGSSAAGHRVVKPLCDVEVLKKCQQLFVVLWCFDPKKFSPNLGPRFGLNFFFFGGRLPQ